MAQAAAHLQMKIPKPRSEILASVLITAFVAFFVALSVVNLMRRDAMIPSAIWLLLVTAVIFTGCRVEGTRTVLRGFLGSFASTQFVERAAGEGQRAEVCFGYRLFGHRFFHLRLPIDKIRSVEWHTGQSSSLAGRDMNDWLVALWFDQDDPAKRVEGTRKPDQDVYIVGPSGKREETAAFGLRFVEFLRESGVPLVLGMDDSTFERGDPRTNESGTGPTPRCD
jgi:hypothetical protein